MQAEFILLVAALCIVGALVLLILVRRSPFPTWLARIGTTVVLAFVLIRAASFHDMDRFVNTRSIGLRWNWVLEIGGISIVLLASERRRRWKTNADA